MYFGFWPFFVLYVLKFEIKKEKVPTLNGIPGSVLGFLGVEKKMLFFDMEGNAILWCVRKTYSLSNN